MCYENIYCHWVSEWGLTSCSTHYRSCQRRSSRQSLAPVQTTKTNSKINETDTKKSKIQYYTTYIYTHTNVILTNKRQSKYTSTKRKAWFRHLLHHQARKGEWAYSTTPNTHTVTEIGVHNGKQWEYTMTANLVRANQSDNRDVTLNKVQHL